MILLNQGKIKIKQSNVTCILKVLLFILKLNIVMKILIMMLKNDLTYLTMMSELR